MNTLANIFSYYNNGEHDVYHYVLGKILENTNLFFHASIYEIADYCASSTATISRLSQKLGYKNYSDFKHNLFDAIHYSPYNNLIIPAEYGGEQSKLSNEYFSAIKQIIQSIEDSVTEQMIDKVVEFLHSAAFIQFCSFNTEFTEITLQINLMLTGKKSLLCSRFSDQFAAAKELHSGDVVIVLSPDSSMSLEIIPLTQIIHENDAICILITNSKRCIHIKRFDYAIAFEGIGANLDLYGMYMVLDLINMAYRKKYADETTPNQLDSGQSP